MPGPLPPGQHRDALVAEVRARLDHLRRRVAVVVACSGGPDSTALAFLAAEARPDLELHLVHVGHGLRAPGVDEAERAVVAGHADWLGVEFHVRDVEVVADGTGTEAAARDARYAALRSVADGMHAAAVLVGHTADDQAETVLLRSARGTGLDGLTGMTTVAGDVTRPLLRLRRGDVRGFVAGEGLPAFEDPANADPGVRRIVVRDEVLPALGRVAPDPVGALVRLADLARDDLAALEAASRAALEVAWFGSVAVLDRKRLAAADPALARRAVRRAVEPLLGRPPSAALVTSILAAAPGHRATSTGGLELEVTTEVVTLGPSAPQVAPLPLAVPGSTTWAPAGRVVHARTAQDAAGGTEPDGVEDGQPRLELPGAWLPPAVRPDVAATPPGGEPARLSVWLPAGLGPLQLRARRPGDRVATSAGTRRLAAILRDAGMPRSLRERWPLVVAADRVLWAPGIAVDAAAAAAGRADPAIALELRRTDAAAT